MTAFDFHIASALECQKLSKLILEGSYVPQRAQRILVEKSKGLCRQLVVPTVRDALVLQCLSDALYAEIKGKAPTNRAFFEPKEHEFSNAPAGYGTFASWLNFQSALFKFSRARAFVVVTDIANYYDSISYAHLRNVISGITGVEECVLDMLIYVLSDLLWQPDYTPRVEVGLPQINLDAPRLLAHCFLYELDAYLASDPSRDFVRFMDDIDIGVDSIVAAKQVLKSVDLVLQTKQVRLNSGKTAILSRAEAIKHFRVVENARLDALRDRIERRRKLGMPLGRERRVIELRIARGLRKRQFDTGNGDKILKRWIGLATRTGARITPASIESMLRLRPAMRDTVLAYIRSKPLTPAKAGALLSCATSGMLVDDAAAVDMTNYVLETSVHQRTGVAPLLADLGKAHDPSTYFGFYCRLWLQSKYGTTIDLIDTLKNNRSTWLSHERLGRLAGALRPLFLGTAEETDYLDQLQGSLNSGVRETYLFQARLSRDLSTFDRMFDALKNPNPSRGTGITHAKFLCLLSALQNVSAPATRRATLRANNSGAFKDVYYRGIARRLGV